MKSLKDELFKQYAINGLNRLSAEYRKQYQPKKGERFNYKGITYEIGRPNVSGGMVEFEISSKIPQADLLPEVSLNDYFDAVKEQVLKSKSVPVSIDISNIVQEKDDKKEEERGYVRLQYSHPEKDLYNDQEISEEMENIQEGCSQIELPDIPEVNTQAAKLVLLLIEERTYDLARTSMQALIDANEVVRQKSCKT